MALFLFSRLYFIQGALCQQEWRVPELLHRLLGVIESHLNHPYKNVRDRLGRYVLRLFESPYRTSRPSYLFRAVGTLIVYNLCGSDTQAFFFSSFVAYFVARWCMTSTCRTAHRRDLQTGRSLSAKYFLSWQGCRNWHEKRRSWAEVTSVQKMRNVWIRRK